MTYHAGCVQTQFIFLIWHNETFWGGRGVGSGRTIVTVQDTVI